MSDVIVNEQVFTRRDVHFRFQPSTGQGKWNYLESIMSRFPSLQGSRHLPRDEGKHDGLRRR
jgi:hypothetical protein